MPTSDEVKLEIWNLAVLSIGERPIASLVEASKAAQLCARLHDRLLGNILSGFDWKFAKTTAALTLTVPAPTVYRYAFTYDLPADCLRARRVIYEGMSWDDDSRVEFDVEGRKLKCDVEGAVLQYTKLITDATLYDTLFIDVFSKYLAVHLALPLTGKIEVQGGAMRMLQIVSPHSEAATANEQAKPGRTSTKGSRS
jgi:hypothetical protein